MKLLRWVVVAAILAYVAWIALPVMQTAFFDVSPNAPVSSRAQDDIAPRAGVGEASIYDNEATPIESIQGEAAVEAMREGKTPVIALWAGVIALYLIAAFLHANGNIRATLAYGFGFIADLVLTFVTKGQGGSDIFKTIVDVLSQWDPRYVITLAAVVLGILMLLAKDLPFKKPKFEPELEL